MPEQAPLISVVTVCWNSAATIGDSLASVAGQTYPKVEHVVVDGGSTDGTMDVVRRFSHVARAVSERDNGIYDAMNKGIRMTTGEIIGTLNADDFYPDSNTLAQVAQVFADPEVDACYSDLCYVSSANTQRVVRYWKSSPYRNGLYERGWCPPHPTFFVRRRIYDRFGLFDERYRIASDVELTMRMLAHHGVNAVYLPAVLVHMRLGGTTNRSLRNIIRQNVEIRDALVRNGLKASPLRFFGGKAASRIMQFIRRPS
jgi:glycosyltransferase involved in cell wall biosynthesis